MARDVPIRKGRAGESAANGKRESTHNAMERAALATAVSAPAEAATLAPPAEQHTHPATGQQPSVAAAQAAATRRQRHDLREYITVEGLLYLLIGLGAIFSRFWDLGRQAEHHDESLHSYFSWLYYTGAGYTHDPLMHGPFLFHIASLSYLLFGDSDASSRYGAALFGAATVLLPWFLRRELGRWGALAASVLLLTSPSFLYFGRFHRHDVYSAFFTLLFFIAVMRFVARPRLAWALTGAATWGLLFTNKEDFFIVTAIFGSALVIALLWSAARRVLFLGAGFVVALALVSRLLPKLLGWPELPRIPFDNPTNTAVQAYATALVTNPVILCGLLLLIAFVVLVVQTLSAAAVGQRWADGILGRFPAGTPMYAARALLKDRRALWLMLIIAAGIYITLYTSLFSNISGILTGSFGAIFYWLAQQGERRAEEPWFYYLLLMPQYDPLAVLVGGFGAVLTTWRLLAHRLFGRFEGPVPFVRGLLLYWALATIAIYSWAGEKMPWMDIHLVLPLLLFAAALLGTAIERLLAEVRRARAGDTAAGFLPPFTRAAWAVPGMMLVLIVGWFLGAARLSSGGPGAGERGWWLLLLPLILLLALGIGYGVWAGWGRAGRVALLGLTAAMLLFHIHAGWALAFQTGDVPKDMLIYVQTSPDVTRVMGELDEFSALKTGGKNLSIMYDDNTSWPFQWYLRNYPNKQYFGCTAGASCSLTDAPPDDVAVVLVGNENLAAHPELATLLSNYQGTAYAMRWHFPEDVYRNFAIAPELGPGWSAWTAQDQPHDTRAVVGSVLSSLTTTLTPDGQARLFRLLAYRDLGAPLGSYDFTVFVRKDLVPEYNTIRYK